MCHIYDEGMTQLLRLTLVVRCAAWSEKINSPYLVGLQLSKFPFSSEKSGGTKVTQVVKLDPANNPHW